ncbi:MAG: hypothetical protein ACHQ15_07300 [Candidatus Limnocylindrales bacterium]
MSCASTDLDHRLPGLGLLYERAGPDGFADPAAVTDTDRVPHLDRDIDAVAERDLDELETSA